MIRQVTFGFLISMMSSCFTCNHGIILNDNGGHSRQQPKGRLQLMLGLRSAVTCADLHLSYEPGKLSQWFCHETLFLGYCYCYYCCVIIARKCGWGNALDGICVFVCVCLCPFFSYSKFWRISYTPCFRKNHPLILLAISWGIVVWF